MTFDELFAEHNLTPDERKALVMHLATLRAQKTVAALQDCPMKLFLIAQDENNKYETYDSAVVCAPDEAAARVMDPGGKGGAPPRWNYMYSSWCSSPDKVTVRLIGDAAPGLPLGVVCASFNAG